MKIIIADYSPHWPGIFAEEVTVLKQLLPSGAFVEHIGSTSVPGLAAKPVIDILIGLESLGQADALVPRIETLGYEYVAEYEAELPERRFFRKDRSGVRTHHIHMVAAGSDFWNRHLAFRDFLRANPVTADEYAVLKRALAERDWKDGNEYADAKSDFIRRIERQIGV